MVDAEQNRARDLRMRGTKAVADRWRRVKRTTGTAVGAASDAYNSALDWKGNSAASRWMTDHLSHQAVTIGSRAMDHKFNITHIGGGWHRLYDGGHTIAGSWKAVSEAFPDLTALERIGTWANEYWKDFITTRGMPIVLLDHAHHVGEYLKHLDCVDAAQAIGGELVGVSIYCNWNDPAKLVASATASELSGAWYANIVAPLVSLIGVARACWLLRQSEHQALQDLIAPALQGLTRSGTTLLFVTVVPGGFLLHFSGNIAISLAHRHAWSSLTANKGAIFASLKECIQGFSAREPATA